MKPPKLRTVLLFPPHVSPDPTTLPLLTALQSLLNVSYTARHCTRPDIFGTSHLRLADPANFADIIGVDGFTVAIFAVKSDAGQSQTGSSNDIEGYAAREGEVVELVATGSVNAVDDEDIRKYAQWAPRAKRVAQERDFESNSISTASEKLNGKLQALYRERQNPPLMHELRAFAVSPGHQGFGLGAHVLKKIEWLLGSDGAEVVDFARGVETPFSLGEGLSSSFRLENGGLVPGIDFDEVKILFGQRKIVDVAASGAKRLENDTVNGVERSSSQFSRRKLVLVAIRELGNEGYYQRRGYKSLGTGILPLGIWGSRAECTTVYMEKNI
ncbi:MAG: hypothetical protein ASARMPRED_008810 [Alectoria sarmentosa]|nr:MAG: hypothetical protein ASARMPRED_008810 [Alectoria sarmentosa]